jgi:D-aminopeptidase
MKILISADMEGISGIVHPVETNAGGSDYERGRALMTADVNAVIDGVRQAAPTATVVVADAHGSFRNLLPEQLHRSARLIRVSRAGSECWPAWTTTRTPSCSSATTGELGPGPGCWRTR